VTTTPSDPVVFASVPDGIGIAERSPGHPDACQLLRAFHAEQVGRYGFADPIELDARDYQSPRGAFAVVYSRGDPVGCGGYRWFDRVVGTIEVKKIYVVPGARSHGAGRALLSWLERHALAAGARRAILETGVRNTAALRLFTVAGYAPVDSYVPGRDHEINRAFARSLTGPA
jgi:GNAT superfamily N-acetyltransferase